MNEDNNNSSDERNDFQAFTALKNSDPATTIGPLDLQSIRAKVVTDETPVLLTSFGHTRQLPKWSYAAAAAVVALGFGTGAGYSIAAHGAQTTQSLSQNGQQNGSPSLLCAFNPTNPHAPCNDTPGSSPIAGNISQTNGMDSRLSSSKLGAAASALSIYSVWNGRPWLTPGSDITDTTDQAVGYVFSDDGLDRHALLRKLIAAFGIEGAKATEDTYNLQITSKTPGEGLSIGGSEDHLVNFWYDNPANGPSACWENKPNAPKVLADGSTPNPAPSCSVKTGPVVSKDRALEIAKQIFGKAGLDLANVSWETHSGADYFGTDSNSQPQPYIQVVAHMLVNQQDSQLNWTVEIAPDESVVNASGYLSKPVATAAYDTVGAKTAVLRSQDLKWSIYGPELISSGLRDESVVPDTSVTKDSQGRPQLPITLDEAVITSAEPSLKGFYLDGSTYALLPSYTLCAGERCWSQVSIADKYLVTK